MTGLARSFLGQHGLGVRTLCENHKGNQPNRIDRAIAMRIAIDGIATGGYRCEVTVILFHFLKKFRVSYREKKYELNCTARNSGPVVFLPDMRKTIKSHYS